MAFDPSAIAETEAQTRRRLLLLQAMERQRRRALELEEEEAARTEDAEPYAMRAKLADPACYADRFGIAPATSAEKAEQLLFDMLSSGGAQASGAPSALGASVYDQLGSLLSAFDATEPSAAP